MNICLFSCCTVFIRESQTVSDSVCLLVSAEQVVYSRLLGLIHIKQLPAEAENNTLKSSESQPKHSSRGWKIQLLSCNSLKRKIAAGSADYSPQGLRYQRHLSHIIKILIIPPLNKTTISQVCGVAETKPYKYQSCFSCFEIWGNQIVREQCADTEGFVTLQIFSLTFPLPDFKRTICTAFIPIFALAHQ